MQDAKHSPALLGGATRMPAVQRMVAALFGRLPYRHPLMVGLVEVTCMAVVRQGQHAEQLVAIIDSPAAVEINRGRTRIESRLEITGARVDGHHGSRQGIQPMLLNFIHDQEVPRVDESSRGQLRMRTQIARHMQPATIGLVFSARRKKTTRSRGLCFSNFAPLNLNQR